MITAIVRALVQAGASPEMILAAVEAAEAQSREKEEARLAGQRERTRRHRETHAVTSGNVTQRDVCDTKSPSTETRATHVEDNLKPLETSGKEERKRKATRIPPDFQPDIEAAVVEGLSRQRAEHEARKFIDHFLAVPGEKGLKQDWPATWRNWFRRAADGPYQSQAPPPNGQSRKLSTAEQAIHELDKYRDQPKQPSFQSEADFGTGATIETGDFRRIG